MTKEDVIVRLCGLSELVMDRKFKNMESADCFCGLKPNKTEHFRFSEQVLRYIENTVKKQLQEDAKK